MSAPRVFISYVKEDREPINRLVDDLGAAGFEVCWDRQIPGGRVWRDWISENIADGDLYVPCFSTNLEARKETYFYEELDQAIARMRQMPPDRVWMLPVRLDDCSYCRVEVTSTRRLCDYQWTDVFERSWNQGVARLVTSLRDAFGDEAPQLLPQRRKVTTTEDKLSAFVCGAYDMTSADLRIPVNFRDVEAVLGWKAGSANALSRMAADQSLLEKYTLGGNYRITALGIDHAEEAMALPDDSVTAKHAAALALAAHVLAGQKAGQLVPLTSVGALLEWSPADTWNTALYAQAACGIRLHNPGLVTVESHLIGDLEDEILRLTEGSEADDIVDLLPVAEVRLRDVGPRHAEQMQARRRSSVKLHMRFLQDAVDRFHRAAGRWPTNLDELTTTSPTGGGERFVTRIPRHPLGRSYGISADTGIVCEQASVEAGVPAAPTRARPSDRKDSSVPTSIEFCPNSLELLCHTRKPYDEFAGFSRRARHFVPNQPGRDHDDFARRLAWPEVRERYEAIFSAIQAGMEYGVDDIRAKCVERTGEASIRTPAYTCSFGAHQDQSDPSTVVVYHDLSVQDPAVLVDEGFNKAFAKEFDGCAVVLSQPLDLRQLVRDMQKAGDKPEFPADMDHVTCQIEGVAGSTEIRARSVSVTRVLPVSPTELVEGLRSALAYLAQFPAAHEALSEWRKTASER